MKKKILIGLLALLIAELSFVGYVEARYASSHDVTTKLVVDIVANQYDLTLDANGGKFDDPSDAKVAVDYKDSYGTLPEPSRDGYDFDGWYTEETGGTKIGATDPVEITKDTTIYAHWTANSYTIAYDSNSGSGTMGTTAATYDVAVALADNAFTKTGYTFKGWNTETAGTGTPYADKATVKNLTAVDGDTVALYAQWEANNYAVSFKANGGSGGMENQTFTYDVAENLDKNLFTRAGYTFTGWNTKADGKGTAYADEASILNLTTGGIETLYAQWRANEYTIEYDGNADTAIGTMDSTKAIYDQDVNLSTNSFTRPGYSFNGWNTEADGSGTAYGDGASVKNLAASGSATLYAQWKANTYTVKYDANGGSGTVESQTFTYDAEDFLRVNGDNGFKRTGYNFAGWGLSANGGVNYTEKQFVSNLTTNTEITLFAIWSADSQIVVTFDTCYAEVTADPPTKFVTYDSTYGDLPSVEITGYQFLGWFTAQEGGTQITKSTKVTVATSHTLYAHWQVPDIDLLLMFDGSGSSNFTTFAKHDYTFGEAVTYTGQTWSGKWESFSIGMHNLVKGGTYRLTFDAAFSDRTCIRDEGNEYPIGCKVADHQQFAQSGSTEVYDWVPTDTNKSTKGYTIEFVANKTSMYWLWELSKIRNPGEAYGNWQEGVENFEESYFDLTLSNVSLTLVDPDIEFENTTARTEKTDGTVVGAFSLKSSTDDSVNFAYKGAGGLHEKGHIPITKLIPGQMYTVYFDLTTNAAGSPSTLYHFGFYIGSDSTLENSASYGDATKVWDGDAFIENSSITNATGTFSFKATASTMYWILDMQCVANGTSYNYTINADIILDVSAAATTLQEPVMSAAPHAIALDYYGIDDTNMDIWYPVDEQYPTAGDSYEMAFEPAEGCTMAETITVSIDGTTYAVRTDGQAKEGAPVYDPQQNILTIPAQLLTNQTQTVAIVASAVKIQTEEATEPPATEPPVSSASKTLLEKLLAAKTLQEMNDLLASNEAGAYALGASELSLVRQRADTIYAEAALTEEVRTAYESVSNRLNALVSRLVNEEEGTDPDSTGSPEPPAATDPVETTPPVAQATALDKMLAATTLQELSSLLAGDEAATLSAAELSQVRMYADTLYAEAVLTEEVTTCYAEISDRLNQLVSQL